MLTLLSLLLLLGKGFRPISMLSFVFYHFFFFFALIIHRDHIQVSIWCFITPMFENGTF